MIDYKEIGNRVRHFRRKRGFTQEQLAFELGTSAAYLSNIERAVKKPSLQKLMQIAEVLDISLEELLSPSPDSRNAPDLYSIFYTYSESDKKRLVSNLFEIISILENNS